ncbi:MAG: TaqI-like C-terminal specificity domain-containing protein [Methanoregula sp.]|jgi:hypothetical protein
MLESARDLLARSLVQECHAITEQDLNYTILSSILQVLFLKTGQESGFAEPGTLALLAGSNGINQRLARACSDSGLSPDILFEKGPEGFHSIHPVSDDALREVIRCMDSEKFPVPVSTLPLEDLAGAFEHFLGTRMQVAEGYHVKSTGKSAVLYTGSVNIPTQPVVEYVVKETLGDAFREQGAGERPAIRILDPACGTGIFLLASYRFLTTCKTEYLVRPKHKGEVLRDLACQSVYGTDIDPDSVSAARFVLLLSFIEECLLSGSVHISSDCLQEICKSLKSTIRCGNALIAKDYFSGRQEHPFNAEERRKVNAFSWQEAFPQILDSGGFDVVIGAPPSYRPFIVKERDEYFQTHYDVYAKGAGLYGYFIEKGLQILRAKGSLGFCIPDTFLRTNHARSLRRFLLSKQIEEIVDFGDLPVFKTATTYPCIIRVSNNKPAKEFCVSKVETLDFPDLDGYVKEHRHPMDQRTLTDGGWTLGDKRTENLLKKLQSVGQPLEEYVMGEMFRGVVTGNNDVFVIDENTRQKIIDEDVKSSELIKPFLTGKDIKRYQSLQSKKYLIFTRRGINIKDYPAIENYLKQFKTQLMPKPIDWVGEKWSGRKPGTYKWYEIQDSIEYYLEFEKPKIFYPDIAPRGYFTLDETGKFFCANSGYFIVSNQKYLLGLLNSKLITFYYSKISALIRGGYLRFFTQDIEKLPIYTPDFDNPDDKNRHDRMVALVTEMLELHKHLSRAKTDQEKRLITQEIESTDRQIDSLVYGLYGLTADEIAVVEESVSK